MNGDAIVNFFQRAIKPLRDRVMLMIGRAVLTALDDTKDIQEAQITALFGATLTRVPRMQNFGFNGVPPTGGEGIVVFIGGNRENGVIVAQENRDLRPKGWAVGEAGMYNSEGMIAVLRLGGKLEVANADEDFVTVLSDLTEAIINSQNITAIGPQPMTPASVAEFQAIKTRLDTFKV